MSNSGYGLNREVFMADIKKHSDTQERLDALSRSELVNHYVSHGNAVQDAERLADNYLRAKAVRLARKGK